MQAVVLAILRVLELALLARVIYSWVDPNPHANNELKRVLWLLTEPILAPLRQVIPPIGGTIDITPIIGFFLLQLLKGLVLGT